MRTKHLLYTMALAGTFAACMQDEFVTEGGNNPLEGRKSLGKITLVEGETPATRWTVDNFNTFTPEVGDGFSYFLVDEPRQGLAGQHEYPIDNYELVNHIHTNYVFKKKGNGWDSEANLVEGNYLLVGPAQEGKLDRKPVEIKLPAKQNLALGADGKVDPLSILEEFVENEYPIYIGHRFLSVGSDYNDVLPARYSIFAYPEITVKNSERNDELTPRVTKVILKRNNPKKPFIINAPLDNVKAAKLLTNESFTKAGDDTKNQFVVGAWEAYMNETLGMGNLTVEQESKNERENTQAIPATADYEITMLNAEGKQALSTFKYNNGLKGFTSDLLAETPTSTSQYIVINMPGNGVDVPRGTEFTFNAVIPADQYVMSPNAEDLEIFAVLSNGEVYKKVMKTNSTVEMYPGKRYPDQDYVGMTVKPAAAVGEYFTIDVNEGGTDGVSSYEKCNPSEIGELGNVDAVKTTEDLIAVITNTSSTQTLNVTVEGNQVVYNEAVNNAVANTSCQIVNILGHIKIQGGENALAINNKVSFEDAVIDKGTVVFNSTTATLGTVLVGKGATLELRNAGKDGFSYTAEIHNAGTLKLYEAAFANVYNYETLEVYNDVQDANITNSEHACSDRQEIISEAVNLTPSVDVKYQVLADGTFVSGKYKVTESELDYPIVVESKDKDNVAELVLGADVKIVKNGSIENNGEITGSATLTVKNGLGETLTNGVNGDIKSAVIIEGASHTLAQLAAPGVPAADYKEAATVTNSGKMDVVTVDGKLVMKSGSRVKTVEMTSGANGEIDNTDKGVIETINNNNVTVFAEFTSLDLSTADAREAATDKIKGYTSSYKVEVIRLTGAMSLGNGSWNDFNKTGNTITDIEFAEGSSLNMGDGTFVTDFNISVSAPGIEWTGNTAGSSKFQPSGTKTKKQYVDTENGRKVAKYGYVDFTNCEVISALEQ